MGNGWVITGFVFVMFTPLRQSRLDTQSVYCAVDLLVTDLKETFLFESTCFISSYRIRLLKAL